ncbi:MAG: ABC-2 family transporter protein [Candidatus Latescibacterota bacterium]|nr:ABC-2 family transporter protein [Candidatus Latescibacterota bacterium]
MIAVIRLLTIFFRIGLMNELQYRVNFWIQLGKSVVNLGVSLLGIAVIYRHTEHLNGWQPAELVALLGIFVMMGGLVGVVIQPSMEKLIEDVREGTLDFTLTKPEEAQVLVSVSQVRVWRLVDVLLGPVVVVAALVHMQLYAGAWAMVEFSVSLTAGTVILYSFWLMLSTISFWFVRVENILMIFHSVYDAARWPVTIYPGWLRAILTFLVPVTFAVTVPSQAVVGRLTLDMLAATIALAVLLLLVSRWFWRVGVSRYSGASA